MTIMPLTQFAYIESIVINSLIFQGYYCWTECAKYLTLVIGGWKVSKNLAKGAKCMRLVVRGCNISKVVV